MEQDKTREFTDKVVLITGGSSGIGLATARLFAEAGANVVIAGRDVEKLRTAQEELEEIITRGKPDRWECAGSARAVKGDVSRVDQCRKIVEETAATVTPARLDLVVNSAGVWLEGNADLVSETDWDTVMDTNLKGAFFICRYAIPYLEKTGGCIVNVSSDSGLVGNDRAAVYCASKGGVTLLTRSLAIELARRGIRVNAVCPGDVETPMLDKAAEQYGGGDPDRYRLETLGPYPDQKQKRFVRPEEVAETILFLCSKKTAAINGACVSIDFGLTAGY